MGAAEGHEALSMAPHRGLSGRVPAPLSSSTSPPPPLPPARPHGTQMTTEWGVPGRRLRLRALAAVSRREPLSASEAQEPQAGATERPKLRRTSCRCRAPCRGPSRRRPGVRSRCRC